MIVLGYHGELDALISRMRTGGAAAIVVDGRVVAACEDSRFARVTRTGAVPEPAIGFVLRQAGLSSLDDVDLVAYAGASDADTTGDLLGVAGARLDRARRAGLAVASGVWRRLDRIGGGGEARSRRALAARTGIDLCSDRFVTIPPHLAHLAGAFFGSGFDRALAVAIGARSDVTSFAAGIGRATRVEVIERAIAPDSLIHLRTAIARHLGFPASREEDLATLAAAGDPSIHRRFFRSIVDIRRDGIASVDGALVLDAIARGAIGAASPPALVRALGPARRADEPLEKHHSDIAAALGETIEIALLASLQVLRARTGERDLCLAGALAVDASANGRIVRSGLFDRVHVPAAPHGPGAAMGAALHAYHHLLGYARIADAVTSAYLGPEADDPMVERSIAIFASELTASRPVDLTEEVAAAIDAGEVIAWVQGRAACAAGALGSRSLLADPRSRVVADKVRAAGGTSGALRPFTALVPVERAAEWVELDGAFACEHGLFELPLRPEHRGSLPAVALPDGRVRVQTIDPLRSPRLHALLVAFGDRTGVPILLEDELRAAGVPVAHGPEDAIEALLASSIDRLVLGEHVVRRRDDVVSASDAANGPPSAAAA